MSALPLTPAEAFVLLDPKRSSASEAFKIAFLSLVVQGVVKITKVKRRRLLRMREVPVISLARDPPDTFLARNIVQAVREAEPSSIGIEFDALARSALKQFGIALLRVKTDFIYPSLVDRGLITTRAGRTLRVFKWIVCTFTPDGLTEKQRIEAVLAEARRLPALMQSDPLEAKAIVLAAGSLLLLLPELKQHYGQLATLDPSSSFDSDFSVGGDFGAIDFASFDLSGLDFDFGSFDTSFSDGGGHDGGGDGHGGH